MRGGGGGGPGAKVQPLARPPEFTGRHREPRREAFLYHLQVAEPLPVINLRATPASHLLSRGANAQLLRWLKRHHAYVASLQRVSYALTCAVIGAPRATGVALAAPTALCLLLPVCCTVSMLSTDVLKLLAMRYEFWFFSAMNVLVWALLAYFLADLRALSLLPAFLAVELAITLDADFRTFVTATKHTLCLEIPALLALGAGVYLQLVDADRRRLEYRPYATLGISLVDIFLNALAAVVVFAMRLVYNRRSLLQRRNAGCKIVQCVLFRSNLVLRATGADFSPSRSPASRGLFKRLGISSAKVFFSAARGARQVHHLQQVTLVPPRLNAIDARRTVLPWWPVGPAPLAPATLALLYAVGFLGLGLSMVSIGLPPPADMRDATSSARHMPLAALAFTAAFCGVFACSYQRDLLRALLRNFGFLFPSVHFVIACFCLADMTQWDYRSYAIVAAGLWFHWVLLLDTLTPPAKRRLGFKKRYATLAIVGLWLSTAVTSYAVVLLDDSPSRLHGRDLFQWRLGERTIAWNTKSLLLSRVATILVWTTRLFYDVALSKDHELLFIRGTLDYYCPYDTFPGAAREPPSAVSRRIAVLPTSDKSPRRVSFADSLLLSSSSVNHSSDNTVFVMLGRHQTSPASCNLPPQSSSRALAPVAKAGSHAKLLDDLVRTDYDALQSRARPALRRTSSLTTAMTSSSRSATTTTVVIK